MGSLPLAFTAPAVLIGLLALIAIWYLLRLLPPKPKQVTFPPTRLLLDHENEEETPARTPWWLTLLRMIMAALIVFALTSPVWRPLAEGQVRSGPLALVVDNGWSASKNWDNVISKANALIDDAESSDRTIALVATADGANQNFAPASPAEIRDRLRALEPRPWTADRGGLTEALSGLGDFATEFVWLGDDVSGEGDERFVGALAALNEDTGLTVYQAIGVETRAMTGTENDTDRMIVTLARPMPGAPEIGVITALDERGRPIGTANFAYEAEATEAEAVFELPIELRNQIARLEVSDKASAGEVFFLDERWRRRTVRPACRDQFRLCPAAAFTTALPFQGAGPVRGCPQSRFQRHFRSDPRTDRPERVGHHAGRYRHHCRRCLGQA